MASSSAPNNDSGMLGIGQQCEHPTCMMVDFLPFACSHCSRKYCLEHFQPEAHSCASHDPAAHDRVAPNCPLCGTPVAFAQGTDPNARMERHFAQECSVFLGEIGRKRAAASKMPLCRAKGCSKKLFAPIQCPGCNTKYCAEHRYPSDHACPSEAAKALSSAPTSSNKVNRPAPQAAAALAALKRNIATATAKSSKPAPTPTRTAAAPAPVPKAAPPPKPSASTLSGDPAPPQPAPKSKPRNPFSKTDRCEPSSPAHAASQSVPAPATPSPPQMHTGLDLDDLLLGSRARAEAESRRKALKERARKGVLSEADRTRLAEMDAQADEADKEQCVVM